jgi:hypothetical protein
VGQQRVALDLRGEAGETLVLWRGHEQALPLAGEWLELSLPLAALQHVPD